MFLNIVTNTTILQKIKNIPYFEIDLGNSFRRKDKRGAPTKVAFDTPFVERYYGQTNRLLMKSGKIGSINVYTDHGINQKSVLIYNDGELFEFDFNHNDLRIAGSMGKYLGALLKKIEKDHKVELPKVDGGERKEADDKANKKHVDPQKLFDTPGNVSWDDLQEYMKKKKR